MHRKSVVALLAVSVLLAGCGNGSSGSNSNSNSNSNSANPSQGTSSQSGADSGGSAALPSGALSKPLFAETTGVLVVPAEADRSVDKAVSDAKGDQIELTARWVGTSASLSYLGFNQSNLPSGVDAQTTYQPASGTIFMAWYLHTENPGGEGKIAMQLSAGSTKSDLSLSANGSGYNSVLLMQLPGSLSSGTASGVSKVELQQQGGGMDLVLYPGS